MNLKSEGDTVYYLITLLEDIVKFEDVFEEELYNKTKAGFVRKAILGKHQPHSNTRKFKDAFFALPLSKDYLLTRLYDLYGKEVDVFPDQEVESSFIERQEKYCLSMG